MKIKNWFVPTKSNHFHPHILRPIGLFLVIFILLGINLTYNLTTAHRFQVLGYATAISSGEVIALSNNERAANGLPALVYNQRLTNAAQAKAQDMFAKNYWAHNSPDGKTPWMFISEAGYAYTTAGENLAMGFNTSAGVVNGWMNSAGHRANILNGAYQETGIAVMDGVLLGEETTLVVAMYGAPKSAPAPAPAPSAPTTTTKSSKPAAPAPAPAPATEPAPEPAPAPAPATEPEPEPEKPQPAPAAPTTIDTPRVVTTENLSSSEPRNWAQNASFFLLSTLLLINVMKHTIVWRTKKRGLRHIWLRSHPAAQYILLVVALVANVASGVGVIL